MSSKNTTWTGVEIAPESLLCELAASDRSPYRLMAQELLYLRATCRTDAKMISTLFQSAMGRALDVIGVLRSTTSEHWKRICALVDETAEKLAVPPPLVPRMAGESDYARGWNGALDGMLKASQRAGDHIPGWNADLDDMERRVTGALASGALRQFDIEEA